MFGLPASTVPRSIVASAGPTIGRVTTLNAGSNWSIGLTGGAAAANTFLVLLVGANNYPVLLNTSSGSAWTSLFSNTFYGVSNSGNVIDGGLWTCLYKKCNSSEPTTYSSNNMPDGTVVILIEILNASALDGSAFRTTPVSPVAVQSVTPSNALDLSLIVGVDGYWQYTGANAETIVMPSGWSTIASVNDGGNLGSGMWAGAKAGTGTGAISPGNFTATGKNTYNNTTGLSPNALSAHLLFKA
jgi:hypothetical protein